METFTAPREFVEDPGFRLARERALAALDLGTIDAPIVDVVAGFAALPYCYPMQSCYGHFLCHPGQDPRTLDPVPSGQVGQVRYRIAYVALCLEDSARGRRLRESLARIATLDPDFIQFGCADWFWEHCRVVNTYALQVEPAAQRMKDEAVLTPAEALRTQGARDLFFAEIRAMLAVERRTAAGG